VTDCGNPDYVVTKGKNPVGYIEAKDLGKDLNSKQYKAVHRTSTSVVISRLKNGSKTECRCETLSAFVK